MRTRAGVTPVFAALTFIMTSVLGHPALGKDSYPSRIPNGGTFSCLSCHTSNIPQLNTFGSDFLSAGKAWSLALANMDSDRDGRTNGEELLDPTGNWTQGSPNPGNSGNVTNPGSANAFSTPTPSNTRNPTSTSTQTTLPNPTATPTQTLPSQPSVTPTQTPLPGEPTPSATTTMVTPPSPTRTVSPSKTPTQAGSLPTATPSRGDEGDEVEIEGTIGNLDLDQRTFTLDGVIVRIDDRTEIDDDDEDVTHEILRNGILVEVEGVLLEDGSILAREINVEDGEGEHEDCETEFVGSISEIDYELRTLVANGVRVIVDDSTAVSDHARNPIGFSDLALGDRVEVKGTPQEDSSIIACRIHIENEDEDNCEEEFKGVINEINSASQTLVVGGVPLRVGANTELLGKDRTPIEFSDLLLGGLVEVKYCHTSGVPPLARRIRLEDSRGQEHLCEVEVEGRISELDPELTTLVVNSILVHASGAPIFGHQGNVMEFSDLEVGHRVKVRGCLLSDASVRALRIRVKESSEPDCEVVIRGLITSRDPSRQTVTVGLIEIAVTAETIIRDKRTNEMLSFDDLVPGDVLQVKFCASTDTPHAVQIELRTERDFDLDDDGHHEHHDLLMIEDSLSHQGLGIDLDGDSRTTSNDLILFSTSWRK